MNDDDFGELRISTGGAYLPIQVRDSKFHVVSEGVGGSPHRVPAGSYVITAQLPGTETLVAAVEASAGEVVDVDLVPTPDALKPSPRENLAPASVASSEGTATIEALGPTRPKSETPDTAGLRWSLGFFRVESGLQYAPSKSGIRANVVDEGAQIVRIELAVGEPGTFIAQVRIHGQVPLNVLLPLGPDAAHCELTAHISGGDVILGAYPGSEAALLASRFLAAGDIREGSQVITPDQAEGMLRSKRQDPIAATIGAYLLLRTGELERLHDWPRNLAKWFEWLPDGAVIAGELSAREERADEALTFFTTAVRRGLPIFTDGYSILVSRLRQLARREHATDRDAPLVGRVAHTVVHGLRGRSPHSVSQPDLVPRHVERGAHHMLTHVLEWAPFMDYSAPTVTFRAADPGAPATSQTLGHARTDTPLSFRGTVHASAGA